MDMHVGLSTTVKNMLVKEIMCVDPLEVLIVKCNFFFNYYYISASLFLIQKNHVSIDGIVEYRLYNFSPVCSTIDSIKCVF